MVRKKGEFNYTEAELICLFFKHVGAGNSSPSFFNRDLGITLSGFQRYKHKYPAFSKIYSTYGSVRRKAKYRFSQTTFGSCSK